jgi:microcystin-dependent protein
MSRNGSGTFTVPNTFTANTPITAAAHNANWSDLASEMTNSVAADGQTSMTGPLKAASGTVSAPGIAFASDTNTGLYRIGADNLGIAVNGAKVVDVATTGVSVTGDLSATGDINATGVLKQNGFALIPVGFGPAPWSGLSAPDGWVFVGQTLNRADFPALWSFAETEIAGGNTFYTNGNGTTTFTIKSMAGRVPAGKEASASVLTSTYFGGDSTVLGATGGSESHTLTTAQLAVHSHGVTDPGHTHVETGSPAGGASNHIYKPDNATSGVVSNSADSTASATTGISINNAGSGNAHNNTQPTIILNYIIFAGV